MSKILFLEKNKIIFANGVFGLGYHLELPEKYSMGEEDYVNLNSYWNRALKDLPTGTVFYKQDVFLKENLDTTNFRNSNFLEIATKNYFNDLEFISHQCYLFFVLPSHDVFNDTLINPFKKLNKKTFNEYDEKILAFTESVKSVVISINSLKLQGNNRLLITDMESKFLHGYYDLYFNLFDDSHISDRFFEKTHLTIGDKYAAMVCMLDENKLPEILESKRKDKYLSNDKTIFFRNYGENFSFDLDFSHVYNQIAIIDDNRKHLNDLRIRNDQLHKSSSFDKANVHFAKVTDEIISDLILDTENIRMIRGHNNIIIIADSLEELSRNILKTNEQFRDIDIKPYIPSGNYLNALYNNCFPFFAPYLTENQLYIASLEIFCAFLNNTGNYKNDTTGVMYNSRLSNVPLYVDLWDEKRENINARNFTIYAPTGFGKSFNANHIITSNFSQGYKQVIIDLGGSYKKVAALFPDETAYITYEQGKSLGVNPFDILKLTTDKLEDLVEFISVHYKRGGEISEMEKTSLRKIIDYYYKTASNFSLPNFVKFVFEQEQLLQTLDIEEAFFNRKEFIHLMSEFVDNGAYSFLYKNTNKDFGGELKDKKIIIFELDQARENQLLLRVCL